MRVQRSKIGGDFFGNPASSGTPEPSSRNSMMSPGTPTTVVVEAGWWGTRAASTGSFGDLGREVTLKKLYHFRSDHVAVSENGDMLASIDSQKFSVRQTLLEHLRVNFELHQRILRPVDD